MVDFDLDTLYRIGLDEAATVQSYQKRFFYPAVKELLTAYASFNKKPAILVSGLRGVGKTTILLQLFKEVEKPFYFSADSPLVKTESLFLLAEKVYRAGYTVLFIDEIHKYRQWKEEVKSIYDAFSLQVIASGSSTASLKKGSIFLGRRGHTLSMEPLTFGEFFYFKEGKQYTAVLADVLDKQRSFQWLANHQDVEQYYHHYFSLGGFPPPQATKETIYALSKKMIYEDALAEFSLTQNKVDVIDKLLSFLSLALPGEFSYTSFSITSGYAKSTVYEAVQLLIELGLLRAIDTYEPKARVKGTTKLLFSHPNLRSAFASQLMQNANKGALREEYTLFHLHVLGIPFFVPPHLKKNPDYEIVVDGKKLFCEIGGPSKTKKQFMGQEGVVLTDHQLMVLGFVQKTDQK